jgi:hypothetical protein
MPKFHWMQKSTPDIQILFLEVHSQISFTQKTFSQNSMKREFAELMKKDLPMGVDNPIDMSYFIVQTAGERIGHSIDHEFMMLHSGLETRARDGRLWCGDHEIQTWQVSIKSHNFNVYSRLANLDFHPTTAVIEQVVERACIKWQRTEEGARYIEGRRRRSAVPKEIPREQVSELQNNKPYVPPPWTDDSWKAYYQAHPSLNFEYEEDPISHSVGDQEDPRITRHQNGWTVVTSK